MRPHIVLVGLVLIAGCGAGSEGKSAASPPAKAAPEPWTVTTLDSGDPTPAVLWNGLIGIRLDRAAMGNGKPFFSSDEYDPTGEEKIRELPNPLPLILAVAGNDIAPTLGKGYRQSLDFRTGELLTTWTQKLSNGSVRIESRTQVHPRLRQIRQRLTLLVPPATSLKFELDGFANGLLKTTALGAGETLLEFPYGPSDRPATLEMKLMGGWDGQWSCLDRRASWAGRVLGSKTVSFERTFSLEKGKPKWEEPTSDELNTADIEIDGPIEDQQAIRSFLYYVRTAVSPAGNMSVAPMGLSNSLYGGHVFWDADLWVSPVLSFIAPESAKVIAAYRLAHSGQARKNFEDWVDAGRPTGAGELGAVSQAGELSAMKFPWESSVSGRETVPGPSKFEDHISGTVAWSLDRAAALGLVESDTSRSVAQAVAGFYRLRSRANEDGTLSIAGTMSPDENHTGDDDLYTNLLAQWCLNGGRFQGSNRFKLPRDATSLLTYEGDSLRAYKQAAAVLAMYPLQFPEAEAQAKAMMERFADKVSKNGPAMSDSVHALIWSRLGETEKAYEIWRKSWQEFTHAPLLLFSEKRSAASTQTDRTYFVTGAGGCLQTVIYGFLGFRIDDKAQPGAAWSTPLKNGKVLSIKPNLPSAWKKASFRNFEVLGKRFTLEATPNRMTVTPG